jgi:hypothetical protein
MNCMNGFLTEVRVHRVCIACREPPGP